jgi:hypothetical protein
VNPDLQEERDKCTFDQHELDRFLVGDRINNIFAKVNADIDKHPELMSGFEWYDMTREE